MEILIFYMALKKILYEYDNEIFEKVYMIKSINSNFIDKEKWEKIDLLMNNEYKMKWINFKKEKADGNRCTS